MNKPHIRLATDGDYHAIWENWTQDHVSQYISFAKMFEADFNPLNAKHSKESQIYVMIDIINDKDTIVDVRRLLFGSGPRWVLLI